MKATPGRGRLGRGLLVAALLLLLTALVGAGCGDDEQASPQTAVSTATERASPNAPPASELDGEITVFAASSLTDAFTALGEAFVAANEGVDVEFNFQSSSALATQLNEGAPGDVFASADVAQMQAVADAGNVDASTVFATNEPVVVVPAGSTAIATFEDLATSGYRLVLAGPDVPIGRYAREILANASGDGGIAPDFADNVLANLVSEEGNARAVRAKIELDEADAGIVYATDARVGGDTVETIAIPEAFNVMAEYAIATVSESDEADVAQAFVDFVLSDKGQAILAEFGFGAP